MLLLRGCFPFAFSFCFRAGVVSAVSVTTAVITAFPLSDVRCFFVGLATDTTVGVTIVGFTVVDVTLCSALLGSLSESPESLERGSLAFASIVGVRSFDFFCGPSLTISVLGSGSTEGTAMTPCLFVDVAFADFEAAEPVFADLWSSVTEESLEASKRESAVTPCTTN